MFGRRRDGSLTEEGFITATIVVIISERKEISGFYPVLFRTRMTKIPFTKVGGIFTSFYLMYSERHSI